MQTAATSLVSQKNVARRGGTHARQHPVVTARVASSVMLTTCAVAIGVGIGFALGPLALAIYTFSMPVALLLLWVSADVLRSDEEPRQRE